MGTTTPCTRHVHYLAFGLSSGTQSGTHFDFGAGTLYVIGSMNDGHADHLEVKTVGAAVQVWINGELVDTLSAADVDRVYLNGSADWDWLDGSAVNKPVEAYGREGSSGSADRSNGNTFLNANITVLNDGAIDVILGGEGDDWLFGLGFDLLFDRNSKETVN